jgi:quaternary ammonium compound-resistance protein SugE
MIHWVYLIIASFLEVGWTFSLKYINMSDLKNISAKTFVTDAGKNSLILLPFVGYVLFGIGNIYFFSMAMKQIPASTAFAVWMAVALSGMKLVEIFFYKENSSFSDLIYFSFIVIGIIGLKKGI